MLIEINDDTHNIDYRRRKRDNMVDSICNCVGYKLIKFWTNKPNEYSYVKDRLYESLNISENNVESIAVNSQNSTNNCVI